ncbi:MAG TPA: polysaccharide deacetylase family protein [Terriglobales bacterium]|nr:polysaccharide deacetylase family protein [Terriglobales bacterium]
MVVGYIVGGAAGAAAFVAGYQTMSPQGQWYGRSLVGLPRGSRKLALTYDDGPNDPHTLRLLEVLARHGVHATFFLVGRYVAKRPDIVREVVNLGHVVGNHTFSHPNLIFASEPRTRMELERCQLAIADAAGNPSSFFRPPFGGRRPATFRIARQLGLEPVMWRVTGGDWKGKGEDYIEQKVYQQVRGGDVILLHDGGHEALGADRSQTVLATDRLIARYKSKGYEFVTVAQMMLEQAPASSCSS